MISLKILIINAYNILNILFTEVIDGIKMSVSLHLTNHILACTYKNLVFT